MRWPIRNQILVPFVTIQVLTVASIAAATAWISVRNVERDIQSRLGNVVETLQESSFPLTPNVLDQLRRLSGAHFVVVDEDRRISRTTFAASDAGKLRLSDAEWNRLDAQVVNDDEGIAIAGKRYFAGRVPLRGGPLPQAVLVLYPHADWREARRQAMTPPLAIGGALLLVTISVSIFLSRRLGTRIRRVQQQVSRIAGGDFAPVEPTPLDDELRDLAEAVNRMAAVLEASMETLREKERAALLTQVVGGLAHQLRNAITGARISTQLHQRTCPKSGDESLEVALKQLVLVEEQIKALLRVARGESRSKAPGDVRDVLDATVSLVAPICAHRQIEIDYHACDNPWRISDADAMRAAMLNLMMNAIEAAGPTGRITVRAVTEGQRLIVTVADDGPGVAGADDVFRPFFSTKEEGIGLGLSLVRQAARECGGDVSFERAGGETVFRIELPRWEEPAADETSATKAIPSTSDQTVPQ